MGLLDCGGGGGGGVVVGYGLWVEGCGLVVWRFLYCGSLDWRVSCSWLFAFVYARWCSRTPFGESEGYLYVEQRHVQDTLIKLLHVFQFQTQCYAKFKKHTPICPFHRLSDELAFRLIYEENETINTGCQEDS